MDSVYLPGQLDRLSHTAIRQFPLFSSPCLSRVKTTGHIRVHHDGRREHKKTVGFLADGGLLSYAEVSKLFLFSDRDESDFVDYFGSVLGGDESEETSG